MNLSRFQIDKPKKAQKYPIKQKKNNKPHWASFFNPGFFQPSAWKLDFTDGGEGAELQYPPPPLPQDFWFSNKFEEN